MPFVRKLKAKRVEKGLTQEDMAELLNMSKSSYAAREKERTEFRRSEINRILDILEADYEDIFYPERHENGTEEKEVV